MPTPFPEAMSEAVKFAKNNKKNHGVLSVKTTNPSQVLKNSVYNNLDRFNTGQQAAPWIKTRPDLFVDFMQQRWAPTPAPNDPKGLNKNWAPNVRYYLKSKYPDMYDQWHAEKLVQAPIDQFTVVA